MVSKFVVGKLGMRIAYRYFSGKRSVQAINIISWISIGAITLLAASMIVLMSIFNGFEDLLQGLYKAFYPELKISAAQGKWIEPTPSQVATIRQMEGVANASLTIEDMVLLAANDEQRIALLKGVDDQWFTVSPLDSFIFEGEKDFKDYSSEVVPAIIGNSLCAGLGVDVVNVFTALKIYYPKPGAQASARPEQMLRSLVVKPAGRFRVQEDFDARYILVPIKEAARLFETGNKISSIELKLEDGYTPERMIAKLSQLFPTNSVKIETRNQQNSTLYMVMQAEKWAGFIILIFVLLIASFTMIGVLSMLVIEKKKDIAILKSMGATAGTIKGIFIAEGALIGFIGGALGLVLGLLLCLGQQRYGWITLGDGFIIDGYPVSLRATDFLIVIITTSLTGVLTAIHPAQKAAAQKLYFREE
jgi:lipoprotein-releasing system permease protein